MDGNTIARKCSIKLWRTVVVATDYLVSVASMDAQQELAYDHAKDWNNKFSLLNNIINKKFGPMHPMIRIFSNRQKNSIIGMPVMSWDVGIEKFPCSGMVDADPMNIEEIREFDGKIIGELERMGIPVNNLPDFEWKITYELS